MRDKNRLHDKNLSLWMIIVAVFLATSILTFMAMERFLVPEQKTQIAPDHENAYVKISIKEPKSAPESVSQNAVVAIRIINEKN